MADKNAFTPFKLPSPEQLTLGQLFRAFRTMALPTLSADGQKNIKHRLSRFVADLGARRLVASIRRVEIAIWLQSQSNWKSSHTRKGAAAAIKRLFFWGQEMELCEKNPCWRLRIAWGEPSKPRRPLNESEFRALLRKAPAYLRRLLFFVALTGCRPAEARSLRWDDVDLIECVVRLKRHKTANRTGRPRQLFLPALVVKLLDWIKRNPGRTWHGRKMALATTSQVLRAILQRGPISARDLRQQLRPHGVSARMVQRAKQTIGAKFRPLGRGKGGQYWLPAKALKKQIPESNEPYVFTNERGGKWDRNPLCRAILLIRQLAGLADDATLYLLRHGFAARALKRGVPLKLVSELLGHSRTSTTEEVYLHMEVLTKELVEAAGVAAAGLF
jgi:integrase